jgi:hypothetical protein
VKHVHIMWMYVVVGACAFWVPDIVVHALRGNLFGRLDVICLTVSLPLLTCFSVAWIWNAKRDVGRLLPAGWAAVLGVWLFGPLMMSIGAGIRGGRFFHPEWSQEIVLGTFLFPLTTWVLSTYDGTLFALIIVTVGLPLTALFVKRRTAPPPLPASK